MSSTAIEHCDLVVERHDALNDRNGNTERIAALAIMNANSISRYAEAAETYQ